MDTDDLPDEDQHSGKEVNGESLIADTASRSPAHSSHHSDQNTDESDSDESIEDSPKRGVKRKCDDNGIDHPKAKLEKLESEQNDTDDDDAEEPNKTEDKSEDDTASESSKTKDDDPKDDTKLSEQADSESEDETNSEIQSEIKEETIADDKNLLDTLEDDNQNFKPAETQLTEIKIDTDIASKPKTPTVKSPTEATRQSLRANRNSNPAAFLVKKPKLPTDMSNPAYRKPFNYGWKRELVYRANSENSVKRNGDIYYFTPDGKKVRSMREVIENLRTKDLSTDNFTFYKEPLGIDDPELEIIRVAKVKGSSSTTPSSLSGKKKFKTKKEPKSTEKQSVKAGKSPKFGSAFKVKLSGARLSQGKRTATPGKGEKKSKATKSPMQIGMLPPGWQSPKKTEKLAKQSSTKEKVNHSEQCSIRCKGVDPVVPTMQCGLCLCLYHPECVGITSSGVEQQQNYVCKNCRPEDQEADNSEGGGSTKADSTLPPLTPFSAIKSHAPISSAPPKLHRITTQHPEHAKDSLLASKKSMRSTKLLTVPRYVKMPDPRGGTVGHSEVTKSLVGSVTTWLPPSSTIQMAQSNADAHSTASEPSQSQAIIGGRKFIIIPKQNVLSILPNEHSSVIPASENAPTPSTIENASNSASQIPSTLDGIPATASLGPLLSGSEIITHVITTNNAQTAPHQTSHLDPPTIPSVSADSSSLHGAISLLTSDSSLAHISQPGFKDFSSPTGKQTHAEDRSLLKSKRTIRRNSAQTPQPAIKPDVEKEKFMQNFFAHLSTGYTVLIQVFQYLKVQELLRASRVCRMWRDIAAHSSLWRIVRMKNSQVRDWQGLATSLRRHETRTLDLRKMLIPDNGEEIWPVFSKALTMVESLTRLDLCRCPGTVVEELARSNPRLEIINATILRCDSLDLSTYNRLENLQELRLKSQNGTELNSDLSVFKSLRKLNHLSLLSIKELGKKQVDVLGELGGLQTLELGECADLPENFGSDVLSKLVKLERLRLEKGPTTTCTHNILETVSELRHMEQLELVNFDVKTGFDKAIETCTNIKRLLLIPTYISQSATTNHMVLSGVLQLSDSLTHFTWGVTLELLRVTELFVDQCDQAPKKKSSPKKEKKISGDSIPILKPVPFLQDITDEHAQVEILPIPKLQKLLTNKMEDTKVKILKIPFHATWRQTISDLVQ